MKLEVVHLRRALRYDPETGELLRAPHWKPASVAAKGGKHAVIEIGGKRYLARRVVWALQTGEWPDNKRCNVRMWNGDPFDLRWENLYVVPDGHRQCAECRIIAPRSEFPTRGKNTSTYCPLCIKTRKKENKDWNHLYIVRRYGLTTDDYANMLAEQGGTCAICDRSPGDRRLAIDHNHKTGRVRGLLCSLCNSALGQLGDNPRTILKAAEYILRGDQKISPAIAHRPRTR